MREVRRAHLEKSHDRSCSSYLEEAAAEVGVRLVNPDAVMMIAFLSTSILSARSMCLL